MQNPPQKPLRAICALLPRHAPAQAYSTARRGSARRPRLRRDRQSALMKSKGRGSQVGGNQAPPDSASPSLRDSWSLTGPSSKPRTLESRDWAQEGPVNRPPPLPQAVSAAAPPLAAGRAPSRSP